MRVISKVVKSFDELVKMMGPKRNVI